ncbi:MAG: hypothetical protein IKQ05_02080 [Prevotella sp.]|nr:hypothetical protein [Prevotella sp.]
MTKTCFRGNFTFTLLFTVLAFSACIDSNYDLSDIDKTIAVGTERPEGLRLPGNNSVREIELSDVIDIDNSDVISTDEKGNYLFAKSSGSDDVEAAHPRIDPIVVHRGSEEADYNVLQLSSIDTIGQSVLSHLRQLSQTLGISENDVKQSIGAYVDDLFRTIEEDYSTEGQLTLFTYQVELPDEVIELSKVTAKGAGIMPTVELQLTFSPDIRSLIDRIFSLNITVPPFLERSIIESEGMTQGTTVLNDAKGIHMDVSTKGVHIQLSAEALQYFENHQPDFDEEAAKELGGNYIRIVRRGNKQVLMLQADLFVDLHIHQHNIDKETLKSHLIERFFGHPKDYYMQSKVLLYDIEIGQATGKFNPDVDLTNGIGEFTINSLPAFLEDDDVRLVIDNPQIGICINSNINVTGKLENLRLVTLGDVLPSGQRERLDSVQLPHLFTLPHTGSIGSSTATKFLIHDKGKAINLTGKYTVYEGAVPVEPIEGSKTLSGLLQKIPKAITFECDASVDQNEPGTVMLDTEYTIQPSYDFWAPLAFNYGTVIVYRDTIDGWNDDLKDLRMAPGSYVEVEADVLNRVPADLKVRAYPMRKGANGQSELMPATMIDVEVTTPTNNKDGVIDAGTKDSPKTTHLRVVVRQHGENGLEQLDGIVYRAEAFTPAESEYQGKALNKSEHTLRIENIVPTLHGKVIYNLDN